MSDDDLWRDVAEQGVARTASARQIVPDHYRTVRLDRARFADVLARTPSQAQRQPRQSDAELELPMPDGGFARFRIVESPVMEPELAKRYPQIRTWLGQGIDDPAATLRFDLTQKGFHAQVLSEHGTVFIDPFQPGDIDHYISYDKREHRHGERVRCAVTGQAIDDESPAKHLAHAKVSSGGTLRTYRLAMAATGEYTAFHGGQKADALAGIVTTVNRVNGIYEREVGVRMILVGNNDRIIYTNAATDPYDNTDADLDVNPGAIDAQIGGANYDVGHLVGTGGGGVAFLGVICTSSKGGGLTGSPSPVGDGFDVDYVAHELGHQFGGDHTFNGSGGSCGGANRNAAAAYEPGSGVTIQAYAGICGADNLQPNSEDFFHRKSLDQIITHTTTGSGGNCGVLTNTDNELPQVTAAANFVIPASTPFELEAQGSDADGDTLTYAWEQYDLGTRNTAGSLVDDGSRPLFRPFAPSTSPVRIFPSLRYILGSNNVPPQSGPLPGTPSPSYFAGEVLPSTDRTLNFWVTVRDNRAGGGGIADAKTTVDVEPGPAFAVTSPNTAVMWAAGSSQTVEWNVGNTATAPIDAADVRITLSLDGGYTWPVELAASETNDGQATVTVPPGTPASTQARIKVKAVDNIFFDISNADFTLTGSNTAPVVTPGTALSTRQGMPTVTATVGTVSDAQDAAAGLVLAVNGQPPELDLQVANSGGNIVLSATAACSLVAPTSGNKIYPVRITATDTGGATGAANVNVQVAANRAPTLGTYTGATLARPNAMSFNPTAAPADADGNYAGISVSPSVLPGGGTVSVAPDGTVTVSTTVGTQLGAHVIRVFAQDGCDAVEVREFTVTVFSTTPVLEIASTTVVSGNGLVEPNECNQLDITLANLGSVPATGVVATLGSDDPDVTITQAISAFPDIPANGTRSASVPLQISTSAGLVCLSQIDFDLEVTYGGGGSPFLGQFTLTAGQPAATNYAFANTTGATLTGGTLVPGSNADDGVVAVTVPSGFDFSLYGTPVLAGRELAASSNGTLQFVAAADASRNYINGALPSDGSGDYEGEFFPAAAPTLMPYWDDLRLDGTNGGIYTQLTGTPPNRQWIIEWRGQPWVNNPSTINTRFAVVFYEGQDGFDFIYLQTSNAGGATIGVQAAASGTQFTQFAVNQRTLPVGTRLAARRAAAVCNAGGANCNGGPGLQITPSAGDNVVAEGGTTDTYTLALATAPSGNVTVNVNGDADVNATPAALTFTTANWNLPQTITVTAVNDRIVEGVHAASIAYTASGGGYDAVVAPASAVTVNDNDAATYRFTAATSTAVESAGALQIATALDFATAGTGTPALEAAIAIPVTVSAASTAAGGGVDYTLSTATANVGADGTATPVTVSLAAASPVAEPNETLVLDLGAETGGSAAQQLAVAAGAPATHTLTIIDANTAGVTIIETGGGTAVAEGGATDTYQLVLTSQPTGDVTLSILPGAELTVLPAAMIFTAANWNVPQTVQVFAVDDADNEGTHTGTVVHTVAGGGYDSVIAPSLEVDIADNDAVVVDLSVAATRLTSPVVPNGLVTFEVTAANLSANADATGNVSLQLVPPMLDVQFTCSAEPDAACPPNGSGLPPAQVTLPRGSGVLYTITARVPTAATPGTVYTLTATIAAAAPLSDGNTANNSANATATVDADRVFADGFE